MVGFCLFLLVGCAQSDPLTFLDDMTGPDAGTGSGGSDGTGGMPVDGSGGSGSGGTGTGGTMSWRYRLGRDGNGRDRLRTDGDRGNDRQRRLRFRRQRNGRFRLGRDGDWGDDRQRRPRLRRLDRQRWKQRRNGWLRVGRQRRRLGGTTGTGGTSGRGGSGGQSGNQGTGGAAGGPAATFTQVYTMILDAPSSSKSSCAGSGCHIPAPGAAGISFDTQAHAYQTLLSNAVAPGNAAKSILYTNISSGAMPKGRTKLSATLIALVASWINAGALNN